jgi:hypothetical protein
MQQQHGRRIWTRAGPIGPRNRHPVGGAEGDFAGGGGGLEGGGLTPKTDDNLADEPAPEKEERQARENWTENDCAPGLGSKKTYATFEKT